MARDVTHTYDPATDTVTRTTRFHRAVPEPIAVDTASSASRQHFIDTGRYLTHAEVAEYAD